jgi:hypothetical protein
LMGVLFFLVVWIVLFECTHLLIMLLREDRVIGWAVGPLGVTIMFLHEPSIVFIWLDVLCPAFVSACTVYFGLLTALSPIKFHVDLLVKVLIVIVGVVITSTKDVINAFRDIRHPLWGEARILRNIQILRASWAKIHFTNFGSSFVNDRFGSTPADLLQAL